MKKCRFCGNTTRVVKEGAEDICHTCLPKYQLAQQFVKECKKIKKLLGLDQEGDADK